jgi:plastocyanin
VTSRPVLACRGAIAGGALAVALVATPLPAQAQSRIEIDAATVRPTELNATVGEQVTFTNRSGRLVHVEFLDTSSGHRVFQVSGEIWAVFHSAGRHEYVVHFLAPGGGELRGAVAVRDKPDAQVEPAECSGVTVMGVCLER